MKLTVFKSDDGDCLLLTGADGKNLLVDGGRQSSYREFVAPALGEMAKKGQVLDMVCISHTDSDHVEGILQLMSDSADWIVKDFQESRGNFTFKTPKSPRPPKILSFWHNSFKDSLSANDRPIESQLVARFQSSLSSCASMLLSVPQYADMARYYAKLATSFKESQQIGALVGPKNLRIPVNAEYGGKTVLAPDAPQCIPLGGMDLYVIGPFSKDLEKLRKKWNKWLEELKKKEAEIQKQDAEEAEALPLSEGQRVLSMNRNLAMALGSRSLVTVPNLASIMLLVEEGGKRILLTGDGHARDILKGLKAQGKLDAHDHIQVDVLKMQHHGAEHNINADFCRKVTARDYIFCANGASRNPNIEVLETLVHERNAVGTPYKLWFTNTAAAVTTEKNRDQMVKVEEKVHELAASSGGLMTFEFLSDEPSFVVEV